MKLSLSMNALVISILLTSCVTRGHDIASTEWIDTNGNFTLYVSNQNYSVRSADIQVEIDGRQIIDQCFNNRPRCAWMPFKLLLEKGPHKIRIWSIKGSTELSEEFELKDQDEGLIIFMNEPKSNKHILKFEVPEGGFMVL